MLSDLKTKLSGEKNYKSYRANLASITSACVPFLGVSLSDLTFVDENANFITEEDTKLVNFDKNMIISQIIQDLLKHQGPSYSFEVDPKISSFLWSVPNMPEKEAYEKSLKIEPRESR